jgi:hypothetical protein
MNRKYE